MDAPLLRRRGGLYFDERKEKLEFVGRRMLKELRNGTRDLFVPFGLGPHLARRPFRFDDDTRFRLVRNHNAFDKTREGREPLLERCAGNAYHTREVFRRHVESGHGDDMLFLFHTYYSYPEPYTTCSMNATIL